MEGITSTSTAPTTVATTTKIEYVKLLASDDTEFTVDKRVALMSVTIKNMLEDLEGPDQNENPIPLPNVTGTVLDKVIEYCKYHLEHPETSTTPNEAERKEDKRTDNILPWDMTYMKVEQKTIFDIILAANYLDIKPLLDLACKTVANMIKGKTPEEIRKTFNIVNDFTPEEEEAVRKENEWCEDR